MKAGDRGTCTEVTTHRVSGLFSRGRFSLAICAKSISPPSTTFQSFFTSTEGSRALVCTWLGCCRKCVGTHHIINTTYSTAIHLCACTLYTETHIKSDGLVVSCILASSFPKWAESDSSNSLCGCVSHTKREECLCAHTHTHARTRTHAHAHTH